MTIDDNDAAFELSDAIAAPMESWARVFAHAKDSECGELLGRAAADLARALVINKSVRPETDAVAGQVVVDALARWAVIAGIADDVAQAIIADGLRRGATGDGAAINTEADTRAPNFSDEAIALEFAERHADTLRYVAPLRRWFIWSSTRWVIDETLCAFDLARRLCREIAARCE